MNNLIPYFISDQFKQGNYIGDFKAYTMFIDISGFTSLTESLMEYKNSGSEILANIINQLFKPLVKKVYENGGNITSFAGDAFTAVFKEELGYSNILNTACFINKFIHDQNKKDTFSTKFLDIKIHVKIGLSFGNIEWGILGSDNIYKYYFRGSGIKGCSNSEKRANIDEIISDKNFIDNVKEMDKQYFNLLTTDSPEKKNLSGKIYQLSNLGKIYFLKKIELNHKTKLLSKQDLSPFVMNSVIDNKSNAEFKEIVSVFISFKEPKSVSEFKRISSTIADRTYIYGGYSRLDYGDKGFNFLIIFGAPKSYENNIDRSLEFVISLRETLSFKAGLTFGNTYTGTIGGPERSEYSAIGNVVNLSARLMTKAKPGEILVDRYINMKKKATYSFTKLGDFDLKGRSKKIEIYRLLSRNEIIDVNSDERTLVGRNKELKNLEKFIKPIFEKKYAGITYISGEPGIGKSRLVNELHSSLNNKIETGKKGNKNEFYWLKMPCEEILKKSFNPIIYFLKKHFSISSSNSNRQNKSNFENQIEFIVKSLKSNELNSTVDFIIAELLRSKSIIGGYIGISWKNSIFNELDSKNRYYNFLFATKNLIKALSLIKPVIIEIDDTHWIDNNTQEFIKVLIRSIDDFPISIICPSRFNDNGSVFSLFAEEDNDSEQRIELDFLTKKEVEKFCKIILGTDVDLSSKFKNMIFEKSNGNPFFIEQILLDLNDKGMIQNKKIKVKTKGNNNYLTKVELSISSKSYQLVPSNIQDIIISRIDRLANNIKGIVLIASVIGRKFSINILRDIVTKNNSDMGFIDDIKNIEEDEKIWISLSNITYLFKHAMLRDSAYNMQLVSVLKKTHLKIAKNYEINYKDKIEKYFSEIAFHYSKSGLKKKAIEYLIKAGDLAKENYENEKAIDFYNTILKKYTPSNVLNIDINLKKAEVLKLTGKLNLAINILNDVYIIAKKSKDKFRIQKILSQTGALFYHTGNFDKSMKIFVKQLSICEKINDDEGIAKVFGNIGILHYTTGDYSKAIDFQNKKIEICKSLKDEKGIASAYGNLGNIYGYKGDLNKALEYYNKSLIISKQNKNKLDISNAYGNIGLVYEVMKDYTKAMRFYNKRIKLCRELGDKKGLAGTIGNIGIISNYKNDYKKAMKCHNEYLEISEELGDKEGKAIAYGNIGIVYEEKGEFSKALEFQLKKLKIKESINDQRGISLTLGNIANVLSELKKFHEAIDHYDRALEIDRKLNLPNLQVYHLSDKAGCQFLMKEYLEAKIVSKKALKISIDSRIEDKISFLNDLILKISKKL